jgi:hypothetical protein
MDSDPRDYLDFHFIREAFLDYLALTSSNSIMTTKSQSRSTPQQSQTAEVKDSPSASCQKCVKVLRDLIATLQNDASSHHDDDIKSKGFFSGSSVASSVTVEEPAPLTLLKAIAGMNNRERLKVEMVDDGVKLHMPVETTLPDKLLSWSQWMTPTTKLDAEKDSSMFAEFRLPLALSVKDDAVRDRQLVDPLTIELKCRKCASTGPEAGARAFLMGPQPLSVIVCHTRVHSERAEVEEILTHELVHLYDVQTLKLDLQECENLAYSEVRAAKAAECRQSWHPHLQSYCVRQKAICATNNLFPLEGRACIQRVFEHAFADNRPFQTKQMESEQQSKN